MAKHLNLILKKYSDVIAGKIPASEVSNLTLGKDPGVDYDPKSEADREFVLSHSVQKHPDPAGNGPDVFNGAKVKQVSDSRHGHIPNPKSKNVYTKANEEYELDEAKDNREYDYEGEMAVTKLKTICRHAEHLIKMMKPNTNLPEWVQSKIVKAEDYISTAHDYLMSEMNEEVEVLDELTGYRKKKLFGKDPLTAVANRAINRIKLPPNDGGKLSPKVRASNEKNRKVSQMAFDRMEEEVEQIDEAKCNMTEAGKMCEVHGMKACPKTKASDNQPMMTKDGKKKLLLEPQVNEEATSQAQQKLMAMAYRYKQDPKSMPDASEQVKKLAKTMTLKQLHDYAATKRNELPKKVQKESAPAVTPITFPVTNSREGFKL